MSQPNNQNPEKKRASHKGKDPDLVKYFKYVRFSLSPFMLCIDKNRCSACNTSFHMSEGKIKNHRRTCTNQTVKCWFPNPGSQTKCDMFFVHQRIGASFVCLRCKKTGITQDNALQVRLTSTAKSTKVFTLIYRNIRKSVSGCLRWSLPKIQWPLLGYATTQSTAVRSTAIARRCIPLGPVFLHRPQVPPLDVF